MCVNVCKCVYMCVNMRVNMCVCVCVGNMIMPIFSSAFPAWEYAQVDTFRCRGGENCRSRESVERKRHRLRTTTTATVRVRKCAPKRRMKRRFVAEKSVFKI